MVSSSKFKEAMNSLNDFIQEQVWYQELKTKWEELDPKSQNYLRFALLGGGIFLVILMVFSFIWNVHSLKKNVSDRKTLLNTIQSANDEMRRLKESMPAANSRGGLGADEGPWLVYFENLAAGTGIDKGSLSVGGEKPGTSEDQSKETLFDLTLKHVNIKQVIRYAFSLENGQRPIKLRNLLIDTKSDPTGYMDATLAISAFTPVVPK